MRKARLLSFLAIATFLATGALPVNAAQQIYNINTLAGKVASVNGTAGLQIRFSALIEQEADTSDSFAGGVSSAPIVAHNVPSSPLDGNTILPPDITVNQDTAGAPQNETAIAVDPNNPNRIVAGANDYVTRTWNCTINGTPCSALGDAYSGTYFSNDGGHTWGVASNLNGSSIGTLIPGVEHLVGGPYDAGGDPALAFDSRGHVYYAGLGFDRTAPPNTVAVNKGTFDGTGKLTWGAPSFINQTTSPSLLNDKEWIAADSHVSSAFRDRVYVTWTRFIFNPVNGSYVQSPIAVSHSSNGGATWSSPELISGNVLYSQGSRPIVGPDGTVYVFWDGATRLATLDSIWMVKSKDGGATWSKPVAVSQLVDIRPPANTAFRVNSYPAAGIANDGTLYVAWSTVVNDAPGNRDVAVWSKSTDGGAIWTAPAPVLGNLNNNTRTPEGYPVTQPNGTLLNAPAPRKVDSLFPAVAVAPNGKAYISAYVADFVSPWQTCAVANPIVALSRYDCITPGPYINNARLDYYVATVTSGPGVVVSVTTHPINTRHGFGGGFFGDYTDITAGSNNIYHAIWTDSNNKQTITWFYGYEFVPFSTNQQDIAVFSGN